MVADKNSGVGGKNTTLDAKLTIFPWTNAAFLLIVLINANVTWVGGGAKGGNWAFKESDEKKKKLIS